MTVCRRKPNFTANRPTVMKTLIVPVDFSESSRNALRMALRVARKFEAGITLFHVQAVPVTDPYSQGVMTQPDLLDEERINERLQTFLNETAGESAEVRARVDAVEVTTRVRVGFAAGETARLAAEEEADWVVMGTHGAGGVTGELLGSVTSSVVAKSPGPVLVVPRDCDTEYMGRMACALDHPLGAGRTMRELDELAFRFDADLTFIKMVRETSATVTGTTSRTLHAHKDMGGKAQARTETLSGKDVDKALQEFCEEAGISLLAMIRERHDWLDRLIHRSATRRMTLHTKIPLLVFPPDYDEEN